MEDARIIMRQDAGKAGFALLRRLIPADYPLHWHEYYEIEYVLSGKGKMVINDTEYEIKPGLFCFMTPVDFQQIFVTEPLQVINICFIDHWILPDILDKIKTGTANYDLPFALINELEKESENDFIFGSTCIKQILNCILIHALRGSNQNNLLHNPSPIQRTLQYIQMHFRENLTVSFLADYVGLTPNYLSSVFHKTMGKTLNEYITGIRLDVSTKFLIFTDLPITQICYDCGFGSLSNFMRMFKKQYGVSPNQFRQSQKDVHQSFKSPLSFDFPTD